MLYYSIILSKLEDIWEFIEQLLYDNQEDKERNQTIKVLDGELNNLVF